MGIIVCIGLGFLIALRAVFRCRCRCRLGILLVGRVGWIGFLGWLVFFSEMVFVLLQQVARPGGVTDFGAFLAGLDNPLGSSC